MYEHDRVRNNTDDHINAKIDRDIECRIRSFAAADNDAISARIYELEQEWDIERWLETNASILAFGGLVMGLRRRKWLMVPAVVLPFLLQHAVQGWCPPLWVLRRLGIRTRKEIEREKTALRLLRGDFSGNGHINDPELALHAVGLE